MILATEALHQFNKDLLHCAAPCRANRLEAPIKFNRDSLDKYRFHYLPRHVSFAGEAESNTKGHIKFLFGSRVKNRAVPHAESCSENLHSLLFGDGGTVDIVTRTSCSPYQNRYVARWVGSKKINPDIADTTIHYFRGPTMKIDTSFGQFCADVKECFLGTLNDIIHIFYGILSAPIRSAQLESCTPLGKNRGDHHLDGPDLLSRESLHCGLRSNGGFWYALKLRWNKSFLRRNAFFKKRDIEISTVPFIASAAQLVNHRFVLLSYIIYINKFILSSKIVKYFSLTRE